MANTKTVPPTKFNADNLEFTTPKTKKGKDGAERLISFVRYDGKPLWLETPWLRAPFGVSSFKKGETDNVDWSVNLSAGENSLEDKEVIDNFFAQLRAMCAGMIKYGVENSQVIFGEEHPEAVVRVLFNNFVKQDKEKKYAERISPKIPRVRSKEGETSNCPLIEFFKGGSPEPVELNSFEQLQGYVPKGACVRALISPRIYFVSGKFGISWDIISMKAQATTTSRPTGLGAFSDETAEQFVSRTQKAEEDAENAENESSTPEGATSGSADGEASGSTEGASGSASAEESEEDEESEEEDSSEDEDEEES